MVVIGFVGALRTAAAARVVRAGSEPDELISTTLDVPAWEYFVKTIREEQENRSVKERSILIYG